MYPPGATVCIANSGSPSSLAHKETYTIPPCLWSVNWKKPPCEIMLCKLCDSPFEPKRLNHVYCSEKCRKVVEGKMYRLRQRQKALEDSPSNICGWCQKSHQRYHKNCSRAYKFCSKECCRDYCRYCKYGLKSKQELEALRDRAAGRCEICGIEEKAAPKGTFHIDHDHETCKPRGMLCSSCNCGLGLLGDNLNGLLRAVNYLQRHLIN